jgi:polyisoprenoid-binding protein YceI
VAREENGRRRHLARWIIGVVVAVVVLAVAVPFIYIHLIEGSAPAKLSLPGSTNTTGANSASGTSGASATGANTVDGTWNVGPGSVVGYRVDEVLIGQHTTAVGRSTQVSGALTLSGTTVTHGTFTVSMASVVSDQSQRNAQFDGRIMDVTQYPTATLHLTAPIALDTVPPIGTAAQYSATGDLAMHGVTKSVTFQVSTERTSGGIDVLAEIPVQFSAWNISNPSIGGFVTTADTGTLEALLHLTRGAGNAAVSGGSGSGSTGPGAGAPSPVTVPSTTVPTLTIPAGG